ISIDWRPNEVSTSLNSSEITFRDPNDLPILRLIKSGGSDGKVLFDLGSTGSNITKATEIEGLLTGDGWLSVDVLFDFTNESASIKVGERDNPDDSVTIEAIDFSELNNFNQLSSLMVRGNGTSGNPLDFKTDLDNLFIYQSGEEAVAQENQNIREIITEYLSEIYLPLNHHFDEALQLLPQDVIVELDNGTQVEVGVEWSSPNYDPDKVGAYKFVGSLVDQDIP